MFESTLSVILISILVLFILFFVIRKFFFKGSSEDSAMGFEGEANAPEELINEVGEEVGDGLETFEKPSSEEVANSMPNESSASEEVVMEEMANESMVDEEVNDDTEIVSKGKSFEIGGDDNDDDEKFNTVNVYFGTNRNYKEDKDDFGSEIEQLHVGNCTVTIPDSHETGKLETPFMNLKFFENPEKHIVYQNTELLSQEAWLQRIGDNIKEANNKTGFIFVHGYNVGFKDAARRTAQMVFDLKFPGLPCFYSWPSAEKLTGYSKDEETSRLSEKYLKEYLTLLFNNTELDKIYLIAHSMGSRGVSSVLKDMITENPVVAEKLEELILAAPDINAQIFKDEIVPFFKSKGKVITLYASSKDKALLASRKIHGYSRAGESGENIVLVDSVETIDASDMDTDFLGHSYFGSEKTIITDIGYLIKTGFRADERLNLEKQEGEGDRAFWKFK